jgi:hypothetical protein
MFYYYKHVQTSLQSTFNLQLGKFLSIFFKLHLVSLKIVLNTLNNSIAYFQNCIAKGYLRTESNFI